MEATIMALVCMFLLSLCFNAMLWSTLSEARDYIQHLANKVSNYEG